MLDLSWSGSYGWPGRTFELRDLRRQLLLLGLELALELELDVLGPCF